MATKGAKRGGASPCRSRFSSASCSRRGGTEKTITTPRVVVVVAATRWCWNGIKDHHHHHREEQLVGKRGHKQLRADFVDDEDFDEEKEEEDDDDKEEEEELGTRELLEQSLRMARLSAYFLAKASWPQVKRMKRVSAWTATPRDGDGDVVSHDEEKRRRGR